MICYVCSFCGKVRLSWCTALAQVGIISAVAMGFGSLPMVFEINLATWFNHYYVTTDVPEPKDLETWLEVRKKKALDWTVHKSRCMCLMVSQTSARL